LKGADIVLGVVIAAALLPIAYAAVFYGIPSHTGFTALRPLARTILTVMFNKLDRLAWTASPEGVTSVLWDYRGVDTLYETMVLLTAIMGAVAVLHTRGVDIVKRVSLRRSALSAILDRTSRVVVWLTLIVSAAMAVNGHLTPGGGFVGGSALAVVPVLLVAVFTALLLPALGFRNVRMLRVRMAALLTLITVVTVPLTLGGYFFQNQPKPTSRFPGYPPFFPGGVPLGGTLILLNIIEFVAVGMAFSIAFLYLTAGEGGEGGGE